MTEDDIVEAAARRNVAVTSVPMPRWIPVTERLPEPTEYPFHEVLVWIEHGGDHRHHVAVADVRARFDRYDEGADGLVYIDGFNFQWSGGDNDRTWPQETGFLGEGGYGGCDGDDRITHWMPLPEAP